MANRKTRKPFCWGGLTGYQQLEVIAQGLHQIINHDPENSYLCRLSKQVDWAIAKGRIQANDLKETHAWLQQIAACLRYPPNQDQEPLTSQQVAQEMAALIQQFQPTRKYQRPQMALSDKLQRLWNRYGEQLLHCYDLPGLPPDNLQIESLFNRLRRHQRRVSGRKSTRELRDFGHCQVLFVADSQEELLDQIRHVRYSHYQENRTRLEAGEAERKFFYRLHRNPEKSILLLVDHYVACCKEKVSDHPDSVDVTQHPP